jgi:hypothetical protein
MRTIIVGTAGALMAFGSIATAQSHSVLTGTVVVDATPSPPLSDAEVAIPALLLTLHTDSAGRFFYNRIPKGTYKVSVRRVGYQEIAVNAKFSGTDTAAVEFALTPLTVTLDTVNVKGKVAEVGKFREFEERRQMGSGSFLTREDMEKNRDRPLGEIMTRLPGVRFQRYGSEGAIASTRSAGSLSGRSRGRDESDIRKGAPAGCYAQVFLDGIRVFSSHPGDPLFNINSISPNSIEGIEYYAGAAQTPEQFDPTNADCGTVVIWTRVD